MIQIDIPIAIATGSLIADAAQNQIRYGRAEYYFRAVWQNIRFQIFGLSWIPAYFLANYFGWETTHMWWTSDSIGAYPLFWPIFMVAFFAAGMVGFDIGRRLIAAGRIGVNRMFYVGILLYMLGWVFAQPARTFKLGTYREWAEGNAPWFWQDPRFLWAMGLSAVVFSAALLWTVVSVVREGQHLDRK